MSVGIVHRHYIDILCLWYSSTLSAGRQRDQNEMSSQFAVVITSKLPIAKSTHWERSPPPPTGHRSTL